jgi:hypothetical protein
MIPRHFNMGPWGSMEECPRPCKTLLDGTGPVPRRRDECSSETVWSIRVATLSLREAAFGGCPTLSPMDLHGPTW